MDYHNCKDLPLWAQILVTSNSESRPDLDREVEVPEKSIILDKDIAA